MFFEILGGLFCETDFAGFLNGEKVQSKTKNAVKNVKMGADLSGVNLDYPG